MTTLNEAYQTWLGSKKYNVLTAENLNSLSYSLVFKKYIKLLRFAGYKDSTIKNYMTAVKSYIDMMSRDDVFINVITD